MNFAESIKNLRAMYNITQQELAKIAGVSDKAVSKWEMGRNAPRMGVIEKLADHFGLEKSDIIDGTFVEKDERSQLLDRAFSGRPEMRVLFNIAETSSKEDVEKAIKILEALKGE